MPININKIENLVFAGGGVKVVTYAGAIKALEEKGHLAHIKKVAGVSGGAITALCVASGYNAREIEDILKNLDFSKFADAPASEYKTIGDMIAYTLRGICSFPYVPSVVVNNITKLLPYSAEITQLICERGMHSGDALEAFLEDLVVKQGFNKAVTFRELHKHTNIELFVLATNLNTQFSKIISHITHPEESVVKWVHASGAFPGYFKPVEIASMLYVDGGVTNNYPITIFDGKTLKEQCSSQDEKTLGFKPMDNKLVKALHNGLEPEEFMPINDIHSHVQALVGAITNNDILDAFRNYERTVVLPDDGISTLAFDITPEQKQTLIESGYNTTLQFIEDNTTVCLGEVA